MNRKRKKQNVIMLTLIMLFVLFAVGCGDKQEELLDGDRQEALDSDNQEELSDSDNQEENEADKSPELETFEAKTLDDNTFTQDDLAEKDITVINFWSMTCGPCIAEMPDLAEFEEQLPDNVQLITVCLDGIYAPDYAESILETAGYQGITLIDWDDNFKKVCYDIMYTPTTIFVDQNGKIVGESIIGSPKILSETYTEAINDVLEAMGKEIISDEEK